MTSVAMRSRFRKRLDSLEPTIENLERVAKGLGDKKDGIRHDNTLRTV